jgi:hypothetical protein
MEELTFDLECRGNTPLPDVLHFRQEFLKEGSPVSDWNGKFNYFIAQLKCDFWWWRFDRDRKPPGDKMSITYFRGRPHFLYNLPEVQQF